MRALLVALSVVLLFGCGDSKKRMEERQKALAAAREAEAKRQDEGAPAKAPEVRLEPFWDDPSYVRITPDGPCPDGFWALFPGGAPGDTAEEKKQNAAKRGELAAKLRAATYVVRLRPPEGVKMLDFDAPKGEIPIQVAGTVDCKDSFGNVAIAWNDAKAITPGNSAAKQDAEVAQNIWQATPTRLAIPMKTASDAADYLAKNRFGVEARVVFTLGKVDVDRKIFKTTRVTSGDIALGGGAEDWGAGRLVRVERHGLRVATEQGRTALVEQKDR